MTELTMTEARIMSGIRKEVIAGGMGVSVECYLRMEAHPEDVGLEDQKRFLEIIGLEGSTEYNVVFRTNQANKKMPMQIDISLAIVFAEYPTL